MKRIALAAAFTLAFAASILGQAPDSPKQNDETLRKLSKRERKARISKLEVRFQDFLTDVEPIAPPTEIDTFLALETDAQRDSFIDDFWRRRDALQGTTNLSFKEVYYNRLEAAKAQFRVLSSDRARMFLVHGPPSNVVRADCQRVLQPTEVWTYPRLEGLGSNVRLLFFKPRGGTEYKLWNPMGGTLALNDLVAQEGMFASAEGPTRRQQAPDSASPYNYISRIQLECSN